MVFCNQVIVEQHWGTHSELHLSVLATSLADTIEENYLRTSA